MAGLGSTPGIIVGVGVGAAAAAAIEPVVELPRQAAWKANAVRVLDPSVMASLVAQGGIDLGSAQTDAALEGYGEDKLNALVYLAQSVPGFADAVTAYNRGKISLDDLAHTLVKSAMDSRYYPAMEDLANTWLSPQQVALGIVRGTIPDPGILPVTLDTTGKIPGYPQFTENSALVEAAGGGIDKERLTVMVGAIGLPMSTQQAASATFRSIITRGDFNRSILEGDIRPEWADAIFAQAAQILSADEWAELNLRGFATKAEYYAGAALHGMSQADADNLFNVKGRPLAVHQITTGLARGGTYNGSTADIPAEYLAAIQESNIRPEYYNLAYANRYTLPSAFVLKSLATSGDLTQAQSQTLLLEIGWPPDLAASVSAVWAGGTGPTATQKKQTLSHLTDEYLSGALTRDALTTVLTTSLGYTAEQAANEITLAEFNASKAARTRNTKLAEKQYVAVKTSEAQARQQLAELGWPANVIDNYIAAWNIERGIQVTTLTVAQIAAALKAGALLASAVRPLLADLGEDPAAIETIIATAGADPNT